MWIYTGLSRGYIPAHEQAPQPRQADLDSVQPYQVIYLDPEVPRELWRQPGQQEVAR